LAGRPLRFHLGGSVLPAPDCLSLRTEAAVPLPLPRKAGTSQGKLPATADRRRKKPERINLSVDNKD